MSGPQHPAGLSAHQAGVKDLTQLNQSSPEAPSHSELPLACVLAKCKQSTEVSLWLLRLEDWDVAAVDELAHPHGEAIWLRGEILDTVDFDDAA